jgi:hypothetical protein
MVNTTSRELTDDLLLTFEFAPPQRATSGSERPAIKGRRDGTAAVGLKQQGLLFTLCAHLHRSSVWFKWFVPQYFYHIQELCGSGR